MHNGHGQNYGQVSVQSKLKSKDRKPSLMTQLKIVSNEFNKITGYDLKEIIEMTVKSVIMNQKFEFEIFIDFLELQCKNYYKNKRTK